MEKTFLRNRGFTLIEILIGLAVSGLLILGLTRLYSATLNSYSLQDQLTEMNQNAKFVMKEVSDVLMQAGADCAAINSDTLDKDTIIKSDSDPCHGFTLKVNPRGGLQVIQSQVIINTTVKCSLSVDSAYPFRSANLLEKIPCQTPPTARKIALYTLDSINSATNYIYFHPATGASKDTFYVNDAVCSIVNQRYYLNGTDMCLDNASNVLAENIDSLTILFFDKSGASLTTATTPTLWAKVWSVNITVEAMTSTPDNRYANPPYNDHRRRLNLTYQFRLKNKV